MANTVNGVTAITAKAQREVIPVESHRFQRPHQGAILRARISLDTVGNYTVDDPTVDNEGRTQQAIFIVGLEFAFNGATTFTIATGAKLLSTYNLPANAGPLFPLSTRQVISPGDYGQPLVISATGVNGASPLLGLIHYVIADRWVP